MIKKITGIAICMILVLMCFSFGMPRTAQAQSILTVTNLHDSGTGSLRDAIANSNSGDKIVFDPGLSGTITLSSQLYINKPLTIEGPGPGLITLNGNDSTRIFKIYVAWDQKVTISGLTIANGRTVGANGGDGQDSRGGGGGGGGAAADGGGLLVLGGDALIDNVAFENNAAIGGIGGTGGRGWIWDETSGNAVGGDGGASDLYYSPFSPYGGPDGFEPDPLKGWDSYYYSGAGGGAGGTQTTYGGAGGDGKYRGGRGGYGGNDGASFHSGYAGQGGHGGQGGAAFGGGICLTAGSMIVKNSSFDGNRATGGSGGVGGQSNYSLMSETMLDDENKSYFGGYGGQGGYSFGAAVYIGGDIEGGAFDVREVKVVACSFDGNTAAAGNGGAGALGFNGCIPFCYANTFGPAGEAYNNDLYAQTFMGVRNLTSDKPSDEITNSGCYEMAHADASECEVSTSATQLVADGQSEAVITVRALTYGSEAVYGEVLRINASGTCSISPLEANADMNGYAVFKVKSDTVGTVTLTPKLVFSNELFPNSVAIQFVHGPFDAGESYISQSKSSVSANGTDYSEITATLKDSYGNTIGSGHTVSLSAGSGSSVITPVNGGVTDANGQAKFRVTSVSVENVTYYAAVGGVSIQDSAYVSFTEYQWVVDRAADDTDEGSLRYALANAPAGTSITFAGSMQNQTITLLSTLPAIDRDLIIDGEDKDICVNGDLQYQILNISGGNVTITGLTFQDGYAKGADGHNGTTDITNPIWGDPWGENGSNKSGGAVNISGGNIVLNDIVFENNTAAGGKGGNALQSYSTSGYSGGSGGSAYGI